MVPDLSFGQVLDPYAEVHYVDSSIFDHEVCRLHISVEEVQRMQLLQAFKHLDCALLDLLIKSV